MNIEPIGIISSIVIILCIYNSIEYATIAFIISTLLGSAAAALVGSANIQPAHMILIFVFIFMLSNDVYRTGILKSIIIPKPGFWFLCMVIYGIIGAFFFPRLMFEKTQIFPIGSTAYAETGWTVPLGPVSGNLTQSIYLTTDLVCYIVIASVCSTLRGFDSIVTAFIIYATSNAFFAATDILTYVTGTQYILDPIRNAQYALHIEENIGDLKRITGSFTETSSFAQATVGIFGFTGTMFLCNRNKYYSGILSLISLILLIISTSSTGIVVSAAMIGILSVTALRISFRSNGGLVSAAFLAFFPVALILLTMILFINTSAYNAIVNYIDLLVFNKSSSSSGLERDAWNQVALQNFIDSGGLGVGLGTTRTSSFPLALLSNVGAPGTLLYLIFITTSLFHSSKDISDYYSDVQTSARNACFGLLIANTISGTLVDQGLTFYAFAALAYSKPIKST